ncbi:MAG: hypothetical protein RLZZ464_2264 [Pseudomonadota bacterium]|jgi:uncharacterized protein YndB with AHSA1/START domain
MSSIAPFVISRVFQAPRHLLFAVNTQPEHLAQWLSPEGFHNIHTDMDFRVGGRYHYGIQGPGGMEMWGKQDFLDIALNERLVLIQSFSNREGGLGTHPMAPTWPKYMHVTTTFEDAANGCTLVIITWLPHESDAIGVQTFDAARAGMEMGFGGTFVKLEAYLQKLQS